MSLVMLQDSTTSTFCSVTLAFSECLACNLARWASDLASRTVRAAMALSETTASKQLILALLWDISTAILAILALF